MCIRDSSFSRDGITLEKIRAKLGLIGLDQINRLMHIISQRDKKAVLEICSEILDRGVSVEQFVADLTDYFRNLLFLKCGIRKSSLLSGSPDDYPVELQQAFGAEQLEKAIELLLELHRNLRFSLQQRFDLELVMCQLASLHDLIPPSVLLSTIRGLKAELFNLPAANTVLQAAETPGKTAVSGEELQAQHAGDLAGLIEAVRREKLALSTLLEKCESWQIVDGELRLDFASRDRFSAEQVIKERETVIRHASAVFADQEVRRLRVKVLEGGQSTSSSFNEQAEIVKKVFRGEIVDNGD